MYCRSRLEAVNFFTGKSPAVWEPSLRLIFLTSGFKLGKLTTVLGDYHCHIVIMMTMIITTGPHQEHDGIIELFESLALCHS